jgi:hypothetical protein
MRERNGGDGGIPSEDGGELLEVPGKVVLDLKISPGVAI